MSVGTIMQLTATESSSPRLTRHASLLLLRPCVGRPMPDKLLLPWTWIPAGPPSLVPAASPLTGLATTASTGRTCT
jgi:hypothetical protein